MLGRRESRKGRGAEEEGKKKKALKGGEDERLPFLRSSPSHTSPLELMKFSTGRGRRANEEEEGQGDEEEEEKGEKVGRSRRRSSRLEEKMPEGEGKETGESVHHRTPVSLENSSPSQRQMKKKKDDESATGSPSSPSSYSGSPSSKDRFAVYRQKVGNPERARQVLNDRHPGAGAACRSQRKWRTSDVRLKRRRLLIATGETEKEKEEEERHGVL